MPSQKAVIHFFRLHEKNSTVFCATKKGQTKKPRVGVGGTARDLRCKWKKEKKIEGLKTAIFDSAQKGPGFVVKAPTRLSKNREFSNLYRPIQDAVVRTHFFFATMSQNVNEFQFNYGRPTQLPKEEDKGDSCVSHPARTPCSSSFHQEIRVRQTSPTTTIAGSLIPSASKLC